MDAERRPATVAIVVADGFEDSELRVPSERLRSLGHKVVVVGTEAGQQLTGKHERERATVDATPTMCDPDEFDAVVVPEGWDAEVVCDGNLITSRKPSDLRAFCDAVTDALGCCT